MERGKLPWLLLLGHFFLFFLSKQYLGSEHAFMFQPGLISVFLHRNPAAYFFFVVFFQSICFDAAGQTVSRVRIKVRDGIYMACYWPLLCHWSLEEMLRRLNWPPIHHTPCWAQSITYYMPCISRRIMLLSARVISWCVCVATWENFLHE